MTGVPDTADRTVSHASSARPRAVLSRSALAASSAASVAAGGAVADLRRDAWGHGVLGVAHAVIAAGAHSVRVDRPDEVEALRLEGIRATTVDDADIEPRLLYGLPFADGRVETTPVLRLVGRVLSTKPLYAGEAVSYDHTHRAATDTRIALVTGGYAQGIVRALGNAASVEIGREMHPIVGRVAMDVCVVDIGNLDVEDGAEVTYFGGRGPAAESLGAWAELTGMTAGELLAVVAQHAQREWEA